VAQDLGVVLGGIDAGGTAAEELLFGEELLVDLHPAFKSKLCDVFAHFL